MFSDIRPWKRRAFPELQPTGGSRKLSSVPLSRPTDESGFANPDTATRNLVNRRGRADP
jgi:hypothetical protein